MKDDIISEKGFFDGFSKQDETYNQAQQAALAYKQELEKQIEEKRKRKMEEKKRRKMGGTHVKRQLCVYETFSL